MARGGRGIAPKRLDAYGPDEAGRFTIRRTARAALRDINIC
jgi:hypothetical protein